MISPMPAIFANNLYQQVAANRVCTALGVRLVTSPAIVQIAKLAGFDSLFIELEHSSLSLEQASALCTTALVAGVTPFVRVPHQCGNGFIQRALDGGAMGIVVPHIHNARDAKAAVNICKYPPQGCRSMTGQLPVFALQSTSMATVIQESNTQGSTVFVMIETKDSIDNIDEIAQVEGVDVLLVGSNDLSIELGVPGQHDSEIFKNALHKISEAAARHGKTFGLAGIYDRAEYQEFAINTLGARYLLVQQDSALLAKGAVASVKAVCDLHHSG